MFIYPETSFARDPFFRDPFAVMRRIQEEIDRAFAPLSTGLGRTFPAVNMYQSDNSLALTAELSGFNPEDIEITVKDDILTISGERKMPETPEKGVWHLRERPFGRFVRSVQLPFHVDPDKVDARFHNGVLVIELQRPEEDRPRRIEVKAE